MLLSLSQIVKNCPLQYIRRLNGKDSNSTQQHFSEFISTVRLDLCLFIDLNTVLHNGDETLITELD